MKFKRFLSVAAFGTGVLLVQAPVFAHEAPARHGGVVRTVNDVQYELVQRGQDAVIHVDNHGKPVPTAGMTGKLVVLQGTEKAEASLLPSGENLLVAKGVKLGGGAKAVAAIDTPEAKAITVRFVVK